MLCRGNGSFETKKFVNQFEDIRFGTHHRADIEVTCPFDIFNGFPVERVGRGHGQTPVADGDGPTLGETRANGVTEVRVPARDRLARMVPAFASLTEPVGDGAALATWLLVSGAREQATVFLCGHGGDEVLGGYWLSKDRFRLDLLRAVAWLPAVRTPAM